MYYSKQMKYYLVFFYFTFFTHALTFAKDIYVSKKGNDSYNGSKNKAVATLSKATTLAMSSIGKEAVHIWVGDGVYYLEAPLVFDSRYTSNTTYPITIKAEHEGKAIISGGRKLNLRWQAYKNGIYKASTPVGVEIDQLFINGKNQRMARYPNYDAEKNTAAYNGYAADAISVEKAKQWQSPTGGYIHVMQSKEWGGYHYLISGKDDKDQFCLLYTSDAADD